jgi:hypothetical protein
MSVACPGTPSPSLASLRSDSPSWGSALPNGRPPWVPLGRHRRMER